MEKDNKKARDDARREYNETIRVRNSHRPVESVLLNLTRSLWLNFYGSVTPATSLIWLVKRRMRKVVRYLVHLLRINLVLLRRWPRIM